MFGSNSRQDAQPCEWAPSSSVRRPGSFHLTHGLLGMSHALFCVLGHISPHLLYKMGVFIIATTQEWQEALRVLDNYTKILLKQK